MILVREVFQVKYGKMKEAKALMKEMVGMMPAPAGGPTRLLTDLVGPYYTLVMEMIYKDLAAFEASMSAEMSNPEFGARYQKFIPLIDSGRREIFTIV
jgi:hypothetical protein